MANTTLFVSRLIVATIITINGASICAAVPWAKELPASQPPVLSLLLDADAAARDWQITGKPAIVKDEILGRNVIEVAAKQRIVWQSVHPVAGDYVVDALVRFPDETSITGSATLKCGVNNRDGKIASAYTLSVTRRGDRSYNIYPSIGDDTLWTQPLRPSVKPGENVPTRWYLQVAERFPLDKISPVWDEDFRVAVENDMARLPLEKNVWRHLRIEVRGDRTRMYSNGLLAFDETNHARSDGHVLLETTGVTRVASIEVRPLTPANARYETIAIDDICNSAGVVDRAALPAAGREVEVNDVPFVFPARTAQGDHVDVGASIYRYRMDVGGVGGDPLQCWPPLSQQDPARIRLRVPQGAYRRLWIIAAYDGKPNTTPVVTARFFKPLKGWPADSAARVPALTANTSTADARKLPVRTANGKPASLWLLPLDLDPALLASDFREESVLHLELTKEVKDWRAFPDPMNYGSFQAGLPSGVHIFAMTLEKAPVSFIAQSVRHGNTFPYPEKPVWKVDLRNQSSSDQSANVIIEVTSPHGSALRHQENVAVETGASRTIEYLPDVAEYGLYHVRSTVIAGGCTQSREGTFLTLPPDTRRATARTTRWGLWVWGGGHGTNPDPVENMQLLRAFGSLIGGNFKPEDRRPWGIGSTATLAFWAVPAWATKDPYDPAEYAAFSEECGKKVADLVAKTPDLEYVSMYAEHSVSLRVTHGNPPEAFGKPWYDYTPAEKASIRSHLLAAQAAFEGVRKYAPKIKFVFGHCGPLFSLPFMKQGYPKDWFDAYGIDCPQFERMPERPPRAVEANHLYFLNQEMKKLGYKKELVHVESYYPSSHPLALGHRGAADSIVRTAVSLANGTDRFLACWTLHDCEGYWGSQHYGCIGLISRRPEYNPKPGAPAFATMTQLLDTAKYDGWVPTGSRSAYCVRFKEFSRNIYCLWTIHGARSIQLFAKAGGQLLLVDEGGNETPLELVDGAAKVILTPTPVWVVAEKNAIDKAQVGTPYYMEQSGPYVKLLDDFEKADWNMSAEGDPRFANNSWDCNRVLAKYESKRIDSQERNSKVWRVTLAETSQSPDISGRYRVFTPPAPILIPGKARALSIRARGNSGWGRIIYEVVDAKGEIWQSAGTKDEWNCDDIHSWSSFNFDGWRTMEFPLPSNSPGDDYREKDSVWWSHSAEGIVDLPLKLTKIIIEMPTHQIYVDQMLPVENTTIELDDLSAVYDSLELQTDAPVLTQRAAAGMLKQKSSGAGLPNPITRLSASGVGAPPKIAKLYPPAQFNDGTRTRVAVEPVPGAKEYQIWVAAYEDGRGALALKKSPEPEPLVTGLKANMPLYVFATYTDANGKQSKPSEGTKVLLKDEFLQK